MKLLIITQKVDRDDPILGFFHRWIEEFSKHCESVLVICLEKGKFDLPENVKVFSLGKEEGTSRIKYVFRFYKYIFGLRKQYDSVFVHMNPVYIILGGLFWRATSKKVALWYTHKRVNLILRIAEKLANIVFSASKESFRLESKKLIVTGHGIDTELFKIYERDFNQPITILHVGRVTRIKNIDQIIKATKGYPLSLVGAPITSDDKKYKSVLEELIDDEDANVSWEGSVSNSEMPAVYARKTLSINAAPDGGMDKVVLESLASGCPAFFTNKAFKGAYGSYAEIFQFSDPEELSDKIADFLKREDKKQIVEELSKSIKSKYSVNAVVTKIISTLNE